MSRFGDWTRTARAVFGAGAAIDTTTPRLREAADELERREIGGEAVRALRTAAALLDAARGQLAAELEARALKPATREVEFWKAGA